MLFFVPLVFVRTPSVVDHGADIGRSTFYAHFETKDDLLRALCTDIFEHVFSEDLYKEKTHDFSTYHDIEAMITHILYHLQEHMAYLPGLLTGESADIFTDAFQAHLRDLFAPSVRVSVQDVPVDYLLHHMVCDFTETVRWWTRHQTYSPEEISGFFMRTTPLL